MLFDTIQNKHKPYSFTSLLKTRIISAVITLFIHGIFIVLVLFVVPLVQVNIFNTEVVNVFIAPGDPLILPDAKGMYQAAGDLESDKPEAIISQNISAASETADESLEREDNLTENAVPSGQEESPPSSPFISEFRLDKKTGTKEDSDSLMLAPPVSRKSHSKEFDTSSGKVVDFNQYLKPQFTQEGDVGNRRRTGLGPVRAGSRKAQAIIKGAQFDVTPWASVVVEKIQKNWIIPSDRENPAKGRVGIDVKISKKGDLIEAKVVESSLIQSFDHAALAAIKDSAPFPSLPSTYPGIVLEIYFIFQYND